MASSIFITGTDTGVGKTRVSCALLHALRLRGLKAVGMKPVASGAELTPQGWRNEDAIQLQQASQVALPYEQINPYCLAPAIAPHLAALQAGVSIELERLRTAYQALTNHADVVVVEGAGGWRVPLSDRDFFSDLPESLTMPVLMVVGLRLGCINHAVLTAQAIQHGPCRLVGWVGNAIDPAFAPFEENVATLERLLPAPCWGVLPYQPIADPEHLATQLRLPTLVF